MRLLLKSFCYLLGSVISIWLLGFFYFIYMVPTHPLPSSLDKVGAIVVWTGGGCRIATGLELLVKGKGERLFISGVYRPEDGRETLDKTDQLNLFSDFLRKDHKTVRLSSSFSEGESDQMRKNSVHILKESCRTCHISLTSSQILELLPKIYIGRQAKTTIGNALETAVWVKENNIHSILLVTSPIHVPRSLIECKKYLSHISVSVYPVDLNKFNHLNWYKDWRTAFKVALEYSKYLSILIGLRLQRKEHLYEGG